MNIRFYNFGRIVLRPYYNLFWPSRVKGMENIPAEGGFILCSNHVHWRDPLFLAVRLKKRRYTFLAKAELYRTAIGRLILGERGLGGIPINRGHSDLNAVRKALKVIADGHGLGIFPQGTRSRDRRAREGAHHPGLHRRSLPPVPSRGRHRRRARRHFRPGQPLRQRHPDRSHLPHLLRHLAG